MRNLRLDAMRVTPDSASAAREVRRGAIASLVALLGVLCVLAVSVAPASAYHDRYIVVYWSGYLGPQQGKSSGYGTCHVIYQSQASWSATG